MNATTSFNDNLGNRILINSKELQSLLGCGYASAIKLGNDAGAKVNVGRRVFWNKEKVQKYLFDISM